MSKLVYGVGINDLSGEEGKSDFYRKWVGMLERCYSARYLKKRPSYKGCSVCPEWMTFSNFKSWMKDQDYEGKQLDKDILIPGNKVYGPDTCAFIDRAVNVFLTECKGGRSSGLIGAYKDKRTGRYRASCQSVETGKQEYLGHFDTAEEAHEAWRKFKLSQALILAARQSDPRVAAALIARYQAQKTQEAA